MNVMPIAFVDTFDLAASLRQRLGSFHGPGDRKVLPLRGPKKDADPEDDLAYVWSKERQRWGELSAMLGHLSRLGGEVEWGRIELEMLMPGGIIPWGRDQSAYAHRFTRAHLALRTNPHAITFIGGLAVNMALGIVNVIDRSLPASAINLGETMRVHLIADFRKKEPPEQ